MRRRIVNTFLILNMANTLLGTLFVVASHACGLVSTFFWVLIPTILLEWVLLIPSFWILGKRSAFPYRSYLPILATYFFPFASIGLSEGVNTAICTIVSAIPLYCLSIRRKILGNFSGTIPRGLLEKSSESHLRLLPIFIWKVILVFLIGSIAVFELALTFVKLSGKDALLMKADGIYAHQLEFEKEGKMISVLGMMHFADADFYDQQLSKIPLDSLVLLEGMMDRKGYMGNTSPNPKSMYGRPYQFGIFNPKAKAKFITYNADIDLDQLTTSQRDNELKSMAYGLTYFLRQSKHDRDISARLDAEVKEIRNNRLLKVIFQGLERYNHIVVTWGVGHNEFLKRELLREGFELKLQSTMKVISFY